MGQGPPVPCPVPAAQPPWLWAGLGDLQCPGDLPSHFRATHPHFSNNPLCVPSLKTAVVGGESGRNIPWLNPPRWGHWGAGFQAEGSSPAPPAWHSPFLSLVKPGGCYFKCEARPWGGREAREVPGTVTLWMRAAAQCDPTNQHKPAPAREPQLGGCHRQRAEEKQRSCLCLSLAGKGQWCLLPVLPAPPDALSLPVPPVSVLCVVPRWFHVTPGASCPLSPWSSSEWHWVILGAFALLSLHCDNVLSPKAFVTLCPLVGQRQTCGFWLSPKSMGRQNLGWGWGLPAWVGTAVGGPQEHLRVPSPHRGKGVLSCRMVLRAVSAVSTLPWWPCLQRGLCPCMLGITWWHRAALSPLCQAEGPCLSCRVPSLCPGCCRELPGRADPRVSRCVSRRSAPAVPSVPSVLPRNKELPVVC